MKTKNLLLVDFIPLLLQNSFYYEIFRCFPFRVNHKLPDTEIGKEHMTLQM